MEVEAIFASISIYDILYMFSFLLAKAVGSPVTRGFLRYSYPHHTLPIPTACYTMYLGRKDYKPKEK